VNPVLALFLLSMVPPAPAPVAPVSKDPWLAGQFSFYVENDSLPLAGGDESYTQGLELQLTMGDGKAPWPIRWPTRIMKAATVTPLNFLQGGLHYDKSSSVVLGQTVFTPQNIITYEPRQDDRPFVGHLYVGVASVYQRDGRDVPRWRRFTGRLTIGVTGDAAGAHTAQAAFHVLRESRIPKGWHTQNGFRIEPNALLRWEEVLRLPCFSRRAVNFTTTTQAALGTTQSFVSLDGTLRVGWPLSGFPPLNIPVAAADANAEENKQEKDPTPHLEFALFAGAEGKAMAWNRLARQSGTGPDIEHLVYEWRLGAMARFKNGLSVSYAVRRRSQEIEPLPEGLLAKHWIGSLQIAKSVSGTKACGCRPLRGLRANFDLGRGKSRTEAAVPADPALSLAGHWGIEKSLYGDRLAVAVESTGVVREHGRGDGTRAATLGLEVLPCLQSRHRLQLRVGVGSALVKTQTTPSEGDIEEPRPLLEVAERGASVLGGLRYALRVGKPMSVVANATYSHLFFDGDETGVRRARFWTVTGGVQLHLWGRDRKPHGASETGRGGTAFIGYGTWS
jgi:lipid A 3-O-deacylase